MKKILSTSLTIALILNATSAAAAGNHSFSKAGPAAVFAASVQGFLEDVAPYSGTVVLRDPRSITTRELSFELKQWLRRPGLPVHERAAGQAVVRALLDPVARAALEAQLTSLGMKGNGQQRLERLAAIVERATPEEREVFRGDLTALDESLRRPDPNALEVSSAEFFDGRKANASAASAPALAPLGARRPVSESWLIGQKSYASTAELVESVKASSPIETRAVYWHSETPGARFTEMTKAQSILSYAWRGLGIGALSGIGLGILTAAVAPLLMLALLPIAPDLIFADPNFGSSLAVTTALGGGLGALFGLLHGRNAPSRRFLQNGAAIFGRLTVSGEGAAKRVFFAVGDEPAVDLTVHANADRIEPHPAIASRPAWKDALSGAGYMVAAIASMLTPFSIGVLLAAQASRKLGEKWALGTKINKELAGLLHSSLLLAGIIVALDGLPLDGRISYIVPLLPWILLLGLPIGMLWGVLALPKIRKAEAVLNAMKGQWWHQKP